MNTCQESAIESSNMPAFIMYNKDMKNKKPKKKSKSNVNILKTNGQALLEIKQKTIAHKPTVKKSEKNKVFQSTPVFSKKPIDLNFFSKPSPISAKKEVKSKKKKINKNMINNVEGPPNSIERGCEMFQWLINPQNSETFLKEFWEKKPLHISRKDKTYYSKIISSSIIDNVLRTEHINFTTNIDITSYENGKRENHNPVGRALPHVVWDFYLQGCSIRFLNPQTYIPHLHLLNATLQDYFHSFVGANVYITPPDSQGFAPHYDDIEAFILQIEGKKFWRIYKPMSSEEELPRVSSKNFDQNEIGNPIMEITLEAGDMLYFPRGYIHQAVTVDGEHSFHVTVSVYQKNSWADLFEKMIPQALQIATQNNVAFRKGLPLDLFQNLGLVHSDSATERRKDIVQHIKNLFHQIVDDLPFDDAADQLSKEFIHSALPPVLSVDEKELTVFGDSDKINNDGQVTNRVEMQLDTKIRLLRENILRIVNEEEEIRLYYTVENSKVYREHEPNFIEIEESIAPGIETLIETYPEYVSVENLNVENDTDKIKIASELWSKGLIMTMEPLEELDDN